MVTRKEYVANFPRPRWDKVHSTSKRASEEYPAATREDLEREPYPDNRRQHAVGSTFRQAGGRAAGSFVNSHDELWEEEEEDRQGATLKHLLEESSLKGSGHTDESKGVFKGLPDVSWEKAKGIIGTEGEKHVSLLETTRTSTLLLILRVFALDMECQGSQRGRHRLQVSRSGPP